MKIFFFLIQHEDDSHEGSVPLDIANFMKWKKIYIIIKMRNL